MFSAGGQRMNKFVKRAISKIGQLAPQEVARLFKRQVAETELLESVLDSLSDGIILYDASRKIVYLNKVVKNLIPLKRFSSYYGVRLEDALADKDVLTFLEEYWGGKIQDDQSNEFNYQKGDTVKTIVMTLSTFRGQGDDLSGTQVYEMLVASDITERKRHETRLRRSESLAQMTTMAASVAHEIKNPLASMGIHLQLLNKAFEREGKLTQDEAERYIHVLEEEIDRLNRIVVDFLFAVRPMDVHLRLQDMNRLISDLASFVKPELDEQHIALRLELQDYLPRLSLDENLMKQVFLNLFKNAMNAMEVRGGGILTVSTRLVGNMVRLKVTDTGTGISTEHLSKIFEPYFTTKSTGTGLGLTVVFKVIKEHGGDISVSSEVGRGTTFTMTFPVPRSEWMTLPDNLKTEDYLEEMVKVEEVGDETHNSDS